VNKTHQSKSTIHFCYISLCRRKRRPFYDRMGGPSTQVRTATRG